MGRGTPRGAPRVMFLREEIIKRIILQTESYVGIKEDNFSNRSVVIDKLNEFVKYPLGSSYCLSGLLYSLDEACQGLGISLDLPRTGHCKKFWNECRKDLKHETPEIGDFALWVFSGTILGHAGLVTSVLPGGRMETIEFNTRDQESVVREGDGVYRRNRSQSGSAMMPVLGFVRVVDAIQAALPRS